MYISNLTRSENYNSYRKIVFVGVSIIISSVGLYFMIDRININNNDKNKLSNITVN